MNAQRMNTLTWRNLVAVPSVHGQIPFAHAVREALDGQTFGCIAVELPEGWETATLEAVRLLPRISGVEARAAGFIVMPGDSLIEGVRQGLKRGIPVEFVDLDVDCNYSGDPVPRLSDPYIIQIQGLTRYFELASPLFRVAPAPEAHHLRNRHMAFRLAQLCASHQRVLFICGAAHWEEVAALLEDRSGENCRAQAWDVPPRIALFEDTGVLNSAPWHGEIPFFRWLFFNGVAAAESLIAGLLDAAARSYRYPLGVRDVEKVLHFAARLARIVPTLTPSLHDILSASRDIVEASFAGEVLKTALSYPSQGNLNQLEPCLHGAVMLDFAPRGWRPADGGIDFRIVVAEFGERQRRNPRVGEDTNVQFSPNSWGRYGDEMEREEAFLGAIVQNYLQAMHPERGQSVRFDGDMKGGIDARETLRARLVDFSCRDIYVQEEVREAENDIGAVVLLFDEDEAEHDCECCTSGRHLAFSFTSAPERGGATAKIRWGLLASLLRTYEGAEKQEVVAQIHSGEITYPTYDDCLLEMLRFARKPRVLFVAAHPPPLWLEHEARQSGKVLSYIPIGSLPEALVEEIRTYNVYFYPEAAS